MRKFAFAFLAAAAFGGSANAAEIRSYKVANWDIGVYTFDQNGRFSHCAAASRYKSGITLLFSVTETLEWAIGFSSPDWNLRPNREIDVEYRVDGGRMNTVTGKSVSNKLVRAPLPDSVDLFNQFRYGNRLVASVDGNREVLFNLTSTARMLTEILNCAKEYKGYVANTPRRGPREDDRDDGPRRAPDTNDRDDDNRPQRGPREGDRETDSRPRQDNQNRTATGSRDTVRTARAPERDADEPAPRRNPVQNAVAPATGPTPESRAEATTIASDILRRANITDFQIQRPEDQAENFRRKYDVVWKADGVTGTLRVLAGNRAANVEAIRADVISSDVSACKGKFASGALPAMPGSQSISIFTSCDGQTNWSIYYIAVPRRQGGSYLLAVFGTGDAANKLQSVTNVYRTAALEVLEK